MFVEAGYAVAAAQACVIIYLSADFDFPDKNPLGTWLCTMQLKLRIKANWKQ